MKNKQTISYLFLFLLIIISSCKQNNESKFKLIPVQVGKKWGYVDNAGKIIIAPTFKNLTLGSTGSFFFDGLALVQFSLDSIGFINEQGKCVIEPKYKSATPFHDGKAIVVEPEKYPVVIDTKGNVLFELKDYDEVNQYSENLAQVTKNGLCGYIDATGNIAINPQFKFAYQFENGTASVQSGLGEKKYGLINTTGKFIIDPQYDWISPFDKNGLAKVLVDKKWGVVNKENKYVINPQYDWIGDFKNNLAVVKTDNKIGFINLEGKFEINPQFLTADNFINNISVVQTLDSLWGVIDKSGKFIIQPKYQGLSELNGDIIFFKKNDLWGIINLKEEIIANPQFKNIGFSRASNYEIPIAITDYIDVSAICDRLLNNINNVSYQGLTANSTRNFIKENCFNSKNEYTEYIDAIVRDQSYNINLGHGFEMTNHFRLNDNILDYAQYTIDFGLFKYGFAERTAKAMIKRLKEIYPETVLEQSQKDLYVLRNENLVYSIKPQMNESSVDGELIFQVKFLK